MKIDIELLHKERKQWRENSLLQSQSILRLSQELDNLRKQKEVLQEKLLKSATQDQMKINKYTRIFGLKETDELKNTVYDGDLWRKYRDRQNAMARARRKDRLNENK